VYTPPSCVSYSCRKEYKFEAIRYIQDVLKLNRHKFNTLNFELYPICHLLALLGAHHILHVSRIRVKYNLVTTY